MHFDYAGQRFRGDWRETILNIMENESLEKVEDRRRAVVACAFLWHDFDGVKKVFLPRRAKTKESFPDVFELPGGHIEAGEDIAEGLKREIREEFEMEIEVEAPFAVFTYESKKSGSSIEVVYFAHFVEDIQNIKLHPEDHSEYKWIAENEMQKVYTENKKENDPEFQAVRQGFKKLRN